MPSVNLEMNVHISDFCVFTTITFPVFKSTSNFTRKNKGDIPHIIEKLLM